ncbi:MAG TPA: DNA double-strand break repair nuclease NurA [Pyrinomonadaceae bacterium]|nr:DNA double-strand break repair nuclease NurA [Pyrinomonadaceae bacterium]
MLYRTHLLTELDARREDFARFERSQRDEVREAAEALRAVGSMKCAQVRERAVGASRKGVTLPSAELDATDESIVVAFAERWRSHEEARAWAARVLSGRTTFAADGSQIYPGRECTMPVAAVQVASFENPHSADGSYTKEAHFKVITPDELLEGDRAYESPEQVIGARRFELEVKTICDFIARARGWRGRGERAPVAFLDGSLLISSLRKGTEVLFSKRYAEALDELLRLSRECEVPVVGYIDQSFAPDLRGLIEALDPERARTGVYDAQLLRAPVGASAAPMLQSWGDRTVFWLCRRANLAPEFYDEAGEPLVGFAYMQTTADGNPARVEVPSWVFGAGLLEEVFDAVRAECVVGNGYPYAIETADAAAAMTGRDREQFLRVMQDFAARHELTFRVARKPSSKARRR